MITISKEKLKVLLHAAAGNVKDYVMDNDGFIDRWLNEYNPQSLNKSSDISDIIESHSENIRYLQQQIDELKDNMGEYEGC